MGLSCWQFFIDVGGTFTDVVAVSADGQLKTLKLLSQSPDHYTDAALEGIRRILGLKKDSQFTAKNIAVVKMGTTVATNALLTRKGERTCLAITSGFQDALKIAYQNRPQIFALHINLPQPLYERVIEVNERHTASGEVLVPPDLSRARKVLQNAYDDGIKSCAIVFMHGYRYPAHEQQIAELAKQIGFEQVSVSCQVSPLMKLINRGDTTVVDAYLSPLLRQHINSMAAELGGTKLLFMQSNGGLADSKHFRGQNSILSGPAGGIVGAVKTSAKAGLHKIISFDMGGTSTDVAHYKGEFERRYEGEIAGVRLATPMLSIHTVAAGGGSIVRFDGARYRVGPESAGANPGPACYRKGGPLTITDCNVMTGKLNPEFFPKTFGVEANEAIDTDIVQQKFAQLANEIKELGGDSRLPEQVAEGFLTIAVDNMALAIKKISTQRGIDLSDYTLCCFGGAGGQHACLIAETLGIKNIFIPENAGVLSAYGIGLADILVMRHQAIEAVLTASLMEDLNDHFLQLEKLAVEEISAQIPAQSPLSKSRKVHLRYEGTDFSLIVNYGSLSEVIAAFEKEHLSRYGFITADKPLIVECISQEIVAAAFAPPSKACKVNQSLLPEPQASVRIFSRNMWHDCLVFQRDGLPPNCKIDGPAIIVEPTGTNVIEPGWQAQLTTSNELIVSRTPAPLTDLVTDVCPSEIAASADPVLLELFNNLFMSIAEQMGLTLQNTSQSVNIKERLDFSCAIFDGHGQLMANAPHIPVHLGSMGESVQAIIAARGNTMQQGDVFALNNPYNGGTHLPDITVITPAFDQAGKDILFYVASRGHHADIGGITPGSMPPDSTKLEQEGILIDDFLLVSQNQFREKQVYELLVSGPNPCRNPRQNLCDLQAQVAANERGIKELSKMVNHYGRNTVSTYMVHMQNNAAESVRRAIGLIDDGSFSCTMDDGSTIQVAITVDRDAGNATIDFTGTSKQRPNNFNAPASVCKAAVLYVFRCLIQEDIPLNSGCLKPLNIIIPEGSMLNPLPPAAVVAGNVETSQAVTDALFGALGVMAACQGTMNNFTFGDTHCQYYETICGGSGAGPDFDGIDAVHTHMTNSHLTDPEVLEWRFPILIENFSIRANSGGAGLHHGGNGVIRKIRFLKPMTAAILSTRRLVAPFGLAGGQPGKCGLNFIKRADGTIESVAGTQVANLLPGDIFVIETPGGGGYGNKK